MSKKPDMASALSGILSAKRGSETAPPVVPPVAEAALAVTAPPPSPAPPRVAAVSAEPTVRKGRGGKSSDPNYRQFSVYLPRTLRKKVGRALDDADTGKDFSELVEELLRHWLTSST